MTPEHIPAQETLNFIKAHLNKGAHLLDVGCGKGYLTALLQDEGFKVTAIDKNEEVVAQARANGVAARQTDLLELDGGPYDALLCSRVLNHLSPLLEALAKTHTLLKPDGLLFVEDFDFERMDRASATWFYGLESVLSAGWHLDRSLTAEGGAGALERWQHHNHQHGINSGAQMRKALERHFSLVHEASPPYLYRYVASRLGGSAQGVTLAEAVLSWEKALIEAGSLKAVGLRWVGQAC